MKGVFYMRKHCLIVYYSHSANTRKLAGLIERETGGTLLEIVPEKAYPVEYNAVVEQAKKEIQAGFRPALKTKVVDIEDYDAIFVGTPNWWNTIAPPLAAFLEGCDLSGKQVIPFCTHGGGGSGRIETAVKEACPRSEVLPLLSTYEDTAKDAQVEQWLKQIGVGL